MHMSWISGNLNRLEDPIAKVNSWYICGCPIKQGVLIWPFCMTIAQAAIHFIVLSRSSQAPFRCDVARKCHSAEMLKSSLWWQKLRIFLCLY